MSTRRTIAVREFADALGMSICLPARTHFDIEISDINLPGLQFAGFFTHFAFDRVQLVGNAEMTFLKELDDTTMRQRLQVFFSHRVPVVVVARGFEVPPVMLEEAQQAGVPILCSELTTTKCSHRIANYLDRLLAPTCSRHGGLLDIYGVGIMFVGESGIGKSETALELIKRGHRLVADDVVELTRVNETRLIGTAPPLVRHLMEIRGIGIIDIRHMYGVGAVIIEKSVDIVIELENWVEHKHYDRLGLDENHIRILDVKIPRLLMPVRPGRNLAVIVEAAARNFRAKLMGYNAAEEFDRRLQEEIGNKN